jgi:hypothetical protein
MNMFGHSPLFQFKHGDHTCVFYRSQDALMEVLTPYVAEGLLRNERCFLAQKPEILKRLVYDLQFLGMDPHREIKRGALELHTEDEAYFPNKRFEPAAMMEMLNRSIDESVEKGFSAFRSAGELGWATRGRNECDQVLEFEKMVDKCYPNKPAVGLCQYALNDFAPDVLQSVLQSHKLHVPEGPRKSLHSRIQVRYASYGAEIVVDKLMVNPPYYYVVQQVRQREVIGWGIAQDFDSASEKAEQLVNNVAVRAQSLQ